MAKLEFSNSSISTVINPSLISTIDNLNTLISKNNSMSIPSGFSYSNQMSEYKRTIISIKSDLNNVKVWLERSNNVLDSTIDRMNNDLNVIHLDDIRERGTSL